MDSGLISQHQKVGLHIQKPFHLNTEHKGWNRQEYFILWLCVFLWGAVGVRANSLSSDMHGQDLTVIMLHRPAVPLFIFSGFYSSIRPLIAWCLRVFLPQKILFSLRCLFVSRCATPFSLQSTVPLSLPQVPPHAAGTEQTHPWDSHTQPNHLSPTDKLHVCLHWGVCMFRVQIWASSPAATQLLVHSRERVHVCARSCYLLMYVTIRSVCSCNSASASQCPRKSFEPSPGKPLGTGSGRLPGMCVQSCQMDLCPSRLRLAPGPWQQIRTEIFYKGAADSVQTEPN